MQPGGTDAAEGTATSGATIRALTFSVYLPSVLFAVGQGAVLPVVALTAVSLGASEPTAAAIVALQGIGRMLFNVPAGWLVERLGEQRAMAVGTGLLAASLVGTVTSPSPAWFALWVTIMGCGWSVWLLARLTYVSEAVPFHLRGRALATLGGVQRLGTFLGPLLGAGAIRLVGLDGAYYSHLVLALAGLVVIVAVGDLDAGGGQRGGGNGPRASMGRVVQDHGRVLATVGAGAAALGALRASRHAVLPLWGAAIGLDGAEVSVIFALTSAMDMALFYPAGAVSDRFGRRAVAVPCLVVLAAGFGALPLAGSFAELMVVGLVMGFGNGMGSGIVMTLGADLAPAGARATFLGLWRTVTDVGAAGGPLLVGAVAAAVSLGWASLALGVVGLVGAGVFSRSLPGVGQHRATSPPRR